MGLPVLIIGKSGSGKSTSLRNCQDFGVFNVIGKPLPFRNQPKTVVTDDYGAIMQGMTRCKTKSIVIDDAGYLMTNQFMRGHSTKGAGSAIYGFYNNIGDNFWSLIEHAKTLPEDKIVYFIMHTDTDDFGNVKPKSIGKMLDEKVCIEGLFTIVLHCKYEDGKHIFRTQTDGLDVAKTPLEMFDSEEIDNDLKMVDDTIREYYNFNGGNEND
ncbi:MAG: AAA family ATPase [Ruminiclostridium sp.]|nr:AAA family ATPase [Ruminiclostridium sp.]